MRILSPISWPLALKLSLTITTVVAIVGFMIGAVIVVQDWGRFHDELGEKALLLSESVALNTPRAMLRKNYWSLYLSLKNIAARESNARTGHEVLTAMILDAKGLVQAHLQPAEYPLGLIFSPSEKAEQEFLTKAMKARSPIVLSSGGYSKIGFLEGVVPLFSDQKYMGVVRVRLSVARLYEKAKSSALIVLLMIFFFVIIGSVLGTLVSRRMVKPLTAVIQGLEAVGRGEMAGFAPVPVKDRDEIGHLSVTFNQIMSELAEKKTLEEEVAMSEKLVALGRITAGVAHEVNNPLAGLLNCIDTLQKHPNDQKLINRYLPVIDQGLHRIKNIVHNLLVGLKIEENDKNVSIEHIDNLQDLIMAEIGDRDIEITWDNRADKNLYIPVKLEPIVYNLLKNSLEILTDGGVISLSMYQEAEFLVIEVSDNGPGIPAGIRNQLFDPFFTTKTNGTGLGLWVVYRLVQSMQGVIEVESEQGHGTRFHVSVPLIKVRAA